MLIGRYRVLVWCGFWEVRCLSALSLVGGAMSIYCVSDRRHSVWCVFLVEASVSVFQRRIEAMEMRCYRKILCISYKNHVTNEKVRAKIQRAIGPHEDLLIIVKRRKLQRYCQVSRSSGLAKTILQGTVNGGRREGRQRKRWENNIREWTGLEFGRFYRAVENTEKWRNLVAKSSVVPRRLSRLRER